MKEESEKKYPFLRRAEENDYQRIWEIWMQDHIIQWMSFTKQDIKTFRQKFEQLNKQSDIYVMVDSIEGKDTIVGVRRIKYLSGPYEHIAEFCSMGVDKEYLRKGYGAAFWESFENIVKENPKIKCIRFTQSGGNYGAFRLSDKRGYKQEALFPDWLQRSGEGENNHYYLIERYGYKIIDPSLQQKASAFISKKYEHKLPVLTPLTSNNKLATHLKDDKIKVFQENNLILEFDYFPDNSVIQHIAFLENLNVCHEDKKLCQAALRDALQFIFNQKSVKKIELFSHQDKAIELCQELGFWVRGEKIASFCEKNEYFNEVGVEYSFFDIQDARSLLNTFHQSEKIIFQLDALQNIIDLLEKDEKCDALGKNYLANIVYQIVRDELLDKKLFVSLDEKQWEKILKDCPETFSNAAKQLQSSMYELLNKNKEIKPSQVSIFKSTSQDSDKKNLDMQNQYNQN